MESFRPSVAICQSAALAQSRMICWPVGSAVNALAILTTSPPSVSTRHSAVSLLRIWRGGCSVVRSVVEWREALVGLLRWLGMDRMLDGSYFRWAADQRGVERNCGSGDAESDRCTDRCAERRAFLSVARGVAVSRAWLATRPSLIRDSSACDSSYRIVGLLLLASGFLPASSASCALQRASWPLCEWCGRSATRRWPGGFAAPGGGHRCDRLRATWRDPQPESPQAPRRAAPAQSWSCSSGSCFS
jgi:hypothetical protein